MLATLNPSEREYQHPAYAAEHHLLTVSSSEDSSIESAHSRLNQFSPSIRLASDNMVSPKRSALNRIVCRLAESELPCNDYVISSLYAQYSRNLATITILNSGEFLLHFLTFFKALGGHTIEDVSRKDIAAYVEHEQDRGLKISSVKGKLIIIYAFLKFLVENKIISPDILHNKIYIKLLKTLPKAIPIEDITQFLAVIDNDRDRALFLMLLHTGVRIGELLNVKVTDIILSERKIMLYLGEKNLEGRVVYYSDDADKALRQWLATRNPGEEYLFYGTTRNSLCYGQAWVIMRDYLKKANLENRGYSPHSLRHTFATNMLNAGLRLEVLQQLLGHKHIEMTLQYGRLSDVTRETEYFKAMAKIEQGGNDEHHRINSSLQAVFEKKKLLRPYR
jgi:site-specific recombinase XerD